MKSEVNSCLQILEKEFPQIHIDELSVIQMGWDTLALVVNWTYVFRFPRRPENEAQLEKEMDLLPCIAGSLPLPVPQVEYARRKSAGQAHTLMGYPWIPGSGLDASSAASETVIRQLGGFLTALHRFPPDQLPAGACGSIDPQAWRRQYEETYAWVQSLAFPHLSAPDRLAASLLWQVFLSSADNFAFQPRLIHGDLTPEHILCDPEGEDVCGVIDWGDTRLGDPALDFAGLFSLGGEPLVDRVLSFYQEPVGETFRRRLRFYYTIAPFYEIRYARETQDEARLKGAIGTLSQRLRV